ncbi:hypothetical protein [Acinetobacter sp. WU_MDCI_Abxb74]|uniref:hypothetical protein n=1 Tax=Acinetobacter sp. WU_MDCI_Abxb74 TaxID=2850072 RepID=UPI0021CD2BB5|nr:hypothetical protein [Acinetobacter sp. WU_MDCI_Abxb74]MCU4423195.1 hypothetical protein [Acinetobacter sp. WU_MDCI_Abxb74]
MNNLITAAEAFTALQVGKTVLCRPIGDILDFAELDQFPATIFAKSGYEFCIKVETVQLAGFTFTKPYALDELQQGQEIFVVSNTGSIVKGAFIPNYEELVSAVKNGFVQRDATNAELQMKAFQKALGLECEIVFKEADFTSFMKADAKLKKSNLVRIVEALEQQEAEQLNSQSSTSNDVGKKTLPKAEQRTESVEDDYQKTLKFLLQQVSESKTVEEVNAVYKEVRHWNDEQNKPLLIATHKRLEELAQAKPAGNEPPSLLVQIQTASDLTTLDALEIDVSGRDPLIQPKLMGAVKKRRFELENAASSEPDYLLED